MNEERKIETEEVAGVGTPPRARVTPEFERKRDYLAGFLSGEKEEEPKGGAGSELQATVVEALKSIYDPEIPVDIYELGLIYDVVISEDGDATIDEFDSATIDKSRVGDHLYLDKAPGMSLMALPAVAALHLLSPQRSKTLTKTFFDPDFSSFIRARTRLAA